MKKSYLTKTPELWYLQCRYCMATDMGHEKELLRGARKICLRPDASRIEDYLKAEMITLDHALLNPQGQVHILNEVHEKTGCTCILELIESANADLAIPQDQLGPLSHSVASAPTPQGQTERDARASTNNAQAPVMGSPKVTMLDPVMDAKGYDKKVPKPVQPTKTVRVPSLIDRIQGKRKPTEHN